MLGGAGVALLVAGPVLRTSSLIPPALALVGAEYAAFLLLDRPELDLAAPLLAAALVLAAELAYAGLEPPVVRAAAGQALLGAGRVAARAAGALAVGALVLAVASTEIRSGLALEVLGIAAAVAAVGVIAFLALRSTNHY